MVIAFIVVAGPRALVSADNRATRQAVAQAPALDDGALDHGRPDGHPGRRASGRWTQRGSYRSARSRLRGETAAGAPVSAW